MPTAHATFHKRGTHIHRTVAHIQWGTSAQSIGSCLLLNPVTAMLGKSSPHLKQELDRYREASGVVDTDPTIQQLIAFIQRIYNTA